MATDKHQSPALSRRKTNLDRTLPVIKFSGSPFTKIKSAQERTKVKFY
jgi:hypothetical protein